MDLTPILEASLAIQIHVVTAVAALILGAFVLWRRKGTKWHKQMGKIWVLLMLIVAISSVFINELKTWGNYSPIHLFTIFTFFSLGWAIYSIRRGKVANHKYSMQGLYLGGLIIAGSFSFMPGRIMYRMFWGEQGFQFNSSWPGIAISFAGFLASFALISWYARRERRT